MSMKLDKQRKFYTTASIVIVCLALIIYLTIKDPGPTADVRFNTIADLLKWTLGIFSAATGAEKIMVRNQDAEQKKTDEKTP